MDDDRRHGERRSMARDWQIFNLDDVALKIVIGYVEDYLRNWGRAPSPDELRAELKGRG